MYDRYMPAKNRIKEFASDSYYHIYNRGVERRNIFQDKQDYGVFLSYIKMYLKPKDDNLLTGIMASPSSSYKEKEKARKALRIKNYADTVKLLAYCLLPNHFHFLVYQKEDRNIHAFMSSFGTRYSMYFNAKYKRVGPLFQDRYKAVRMVSDDQLVHVSRYIHVNPVHHGLATQGSFDSAQDKRALRGWEYSSYPEYLKERNTEWVKTEPVLSFFHPKGKNSYEAFIEGEIDEEHSAEVIHKATIEQL